MTDLTLNQKPDKILAVDYGTKRIGLAVSHAALAEPLKIIEYENLDQALKSIKDICDQLQIELIVVGLSEQAMAEQTKDFAQALESITQLPVKFSDETLTSQLARQKLRARNFAARKKPIDHYAAALILDEWLATHS
jgi:putative transcription antitermination factor YqgF